MEHAMPLGTGEGSCCLRSEQPGAQYSSRTTDRVLQILLNGDLSRLRAYSVAENMGIRPTTLRRRMRADHTH
mgnify:FL=1